MCAIEWPRHRQEFPALSEWTYLDTASFGQLPNLGKEAMIRHLQHRDETASTRFLSWFDDMDGIRRACARLVNSDPEDIAFVPSASTGFAWLMEGLEWKPNDEVLTLEHEFPNQLYRSTRQVAWEDFYSSVNEHTRVVAMSSVNYASGFQPPLAEIAKFLRKRGVIFYVDGTQSVGALQMDLKAVPASVLCVDAYKWLLSPNGAGFVYIDPELRKQLRPSVVGWRSDSAWRQVGQLNHGLPVFAESAERFEGGMLCFPSLYAMGAVVDAMLSLGIDQIEERVLELAGKVRRMLADLGAKVDSHGSQIVAAKFEGRDSARIAALLKERKIIISARHGCLRISPHYYNDEADIETLRAGLYAVL